MANLIIKPTSGGSLILQDEGGTAANTIDASGNTQLAGTLVVTGASTMTGNVTMAGTANNLGTVTAGTITGGTIGSAVVQPDGVITNYFFNRQINTTYERPTTTWATGQKREILCYFGSFPIMRTGKAFHIQCEIANRW